MATGSRSWWARHSYGCHADTVFTHNATAPPPVPSQEMAVEGGNYVATTIVGCILSHEYVEVLHASLQAILVVSMAVEINDLLMD